MQFMLSSGDFLISDESSGMPSNITEIKLESKCNKEVIIKSWQLFKVTDSSYRTAK